jgi:phosphonate transport system substrate-binding protein
MMARIIDLLEQHGKLQPSDIRVIWTSDPIPSDPVAVRKGFSPELRAKIQQAFLDLRKDDPKLMAEINAATAAKDGRYIAASNKLFDSLRTLARNVPNIQLLEK